MTQGRFNLIQIIIIAITVMGTVLVAIMFWRCLKEKAKIVSIICIFLVSILGVGVSIFYGCGIVFEEKSVVGTVVSVSDKALPVFMGPSRAYTIVIEEKTDSIFGEEVYSFSTDAFSCKELKNIVSKLNPGDSVLLKYNRWHDLYYCEVLQ